MIDQDALDRITEKVLCYRTAGPMEADMDGIFWFGLPSPIRAIVTIERGAESSPIEELSEDAEPEVDQVEPQSTSEVPQHSEGASP